MGDDSGPKTIHEIREESMAYQVGKSVTMCACVHTKLYSSNLKAMYMYVRIMVSVL